ncbi:hypothetical protein SAMN04487969_101188 [Paenibacillus algorifonticola]|uniref:Uncharacterized protein n=1 Tax=Paenibacillus algorifonticola TaxID=684063 RepID=A0A1I1XYV8_9BACL|nr:hypothetical protein [Paenibacillus algorifonticola]SFE12536.1 hypothetical protein SAMN04487969_101188 [Paenibacillus algorifonticola]
MIESSQTNIWEGHWACAVLALNGVLEEKLVPAALEATIRKNLEKTVEEHPNEKQYRMDKEYAGFRDGILSVLVQRDQSCHALGHDVIYAYYILETLSRSKVPATAELYNAMTKLLDEFAASGPGYVTINESNIIIDPEGTPATAIRVPLTPAVVLDLFHNFQRPYQMEKGDMQLGHLLTHGHSILGLQQEFHEPGIVQLETSLFTRLDVLAYANGLENNQAEYDPAFTTTMSSPLEQPFWEQAFTDSRHGHYYKYAYSYLKLHQMAGRNPSDFRSFSRIL